MADKKKHVLQSRGVSKKGKSVKAGKSYKADDLERKDAKLLDRGRGSSFLMAKAREEADRIRAEKKTPGKIGYQTNLGTRDDVAVSVQTKGKKRMLYKGKK